MKHILVTGATGKVGSHSIRRTVNSDEFSEPSIRALRHFNITACNAKAESYIGDFHHFLRQANLM
jgi:uncharacterized protein YbjT (DUF2867 family)